MSLQKVNQQTGETTQIAGLYNSSQFDGIQDTINKNGAKNLLPNNGSSQTVGNISFTKNADGSVTINGTNNNGSLVFYKICENIAWGNTELNIAITSFPTEARYGNYLFSLEGNHSVTFTAGQVAFGYTVANTTTWIAINDGVTVNNLTVYPMVRLASDTDNTYVPYAMTNKELTDELSDTSSKADSAYSTAALSAYIAEGNSSLDVEILPWAIYFMTVGASGGGGSRFLTAAYYMVAVADNPTHAVVASKIGGSDAMEFTGTFTYKSNNIYTVTNPSGRRIQFWKLGLVTQ